MDFVVQQIHYVNKSYIRIQNSKQETFNVAKMCFTYITMFLLTLSPYRWFHVFDHRSKNLTMKPIPVLTNRICP